MIKPQWSEDFFDNHENEYQTTIILDTICDQFENFSSVLRHDIEAIDPILILFLRRIRRIHLKLFTSSRDESPVISKCFQRVSCAPDSPIVSLKDEDANTKHHFYKSEFTTSFNGAETNRDGITMTDIVLVFPVTKRLGKYIPLIQEQNCVFAYLPLGDLGLKFVIQADFITTSNRQSIDEDNCWNINIADAIPDAFEAAVTFLNKGGSKYSELAKLWPLYLDHSTDGMSLYWRGIAKEIIEYLSESPVIADRSGMARKPNDLMFLDWAHDRNGDPIFGHSRDYVSPHYPGSVRKSLLSLGVTAPNWSWLCNKLKVLYRKSLLQDKLEDAEWCSDLAKVILTPQESEGKIDYAEDLRKYPLIPLTDGTWRCAPTQDDPIYFPMSSGVTIPPGIRLSVVEEEACACPTRKKLFKRLGVRDCDVYTVIERILEYHITLKSANHVHLIAQLKYLYKKQLFLKYYDMKQIYLVGSNNRSWHRGVETYADMTSSGKLQHWFFGYDRANFLSDGYFENLNSDEKANFVEWLNLKAGVALAPRFIADESAALHDDFQWLLANKSDQILVILRQHWSLYNKAMTLKARRNVRDVPKSKQLYLAIQSQALSPAKIEKVRNAFGNDYINFPNGKHHHLKKCVWNGLKGFSSKPALRPVYGDELSSFFQKILQVPDATCAEALTSLKQLKDDKSTTIEDVCEVYVFIQEHYTHTFSIDSETACIALPSFSGSALEWKTQAQCVWDDGEFSQNGLKLESKTSVRRIIEKCVPTAQPFFDHVLNLRDAGITELLADLVLMQKKKSDDSKRVYLLYERIETHRRNSRREIREVFQKDPLVFISRINNQGSQWLPLKRCIWTRSVLRDIYALRPSLDQYRNLFRDTLKVPNATIDMLATELMESLDNHQYVRDLLLEIARLWRADEEVTMLDKEDCWPCRMSTGLPDLCSIDDDVFYINDRQDLFDIFCDSHNFLDFDFDNSKWFADWFRCKYPYQFVSEEVFIETKPLGSPIHCDNLTMDIRGRAGALTKYFKHARCESPYETLSLLKNATVWMSADIETHYTLGEITKTKRKGGSAVIVSTGEDEITKLEIYVSSDSHTRDCALVTDFPEQLINALELEPAGLPDIYPLLQVPLTARKALLVRKGITDGDAKDDSEDDWATDSASEDSQSDIDGSDDDIDSSDNNIDSSDDDIDEGDTTHPNAARLVLVESVGASARSETANTTQRLHVEQRSSFRPRNQPNVSLEEIPLEQSATPHLSTTGLYSTNNRNRNRERIYGFARTMYPVFGSRDRRSSLQSSSDNHTFNMSTLREALQAAESASILVTDQIHSNPRPRLRRRPLVNRSEEELARDFEVGFLGEQLVYTLLHDTLQLPNFTGEGNWTSSLRSRAGFSNFGREVSDFTYEDTQGALTRFFLTMEHSYRTPKYNEPRSHYYLLYEQRSANSNQAKRLHVNSPTPSEIYVILRISGLDALEDKAEHKPQLRAYLDPYARSEEGFLSFIAPTYAVTATA
ncbi:putative heterokaryon incompatibility protein [Dendryphion nanum]|uniref:Heterokaryon incompatibility protein n=1 Tax=Dendryphion nanum TaxID=256645 RepID=A0A9P9ITP3_9PLEO|nr:putative heterokaryon incompatibility protein [Dendryphion nanum]